MVTFFQSQKINLDFVKYSTSEKKSEESFRDKTTPEQF